MDCNGPFFKDDQGRTLFLRGVNLGGSSKVPSRPDGATYKSDGFFDTRNVCFIDRPFPLEEAGEHFSRLKSWGFNLIRLLVTWEAIEHQGPGIYDQDYLEYIRSIVERAADWGLNILIDPHQDVWSRFSGGDGAPGWTFEIVGFDITKFQETGAAFTHQVLGDPLPTMIWPANATKLAAATMFTLFFGGSDLAPFSFIEGESAQVFLQRSYLNAFKKLAMYLLDLPNVVGFGTMNEPGEGYIGIPDLNRRYTPIEKGFIPTPFQSMQLGAGIPQELEIWDRGILGPRVVGKTIVNPKGERVWLNGFDPLWQINGVWKDNPGGSPNLISRDYFFRVNGRKVDFNRNYYVPFNNLFAAEIRGITPSTKIFIENGLKSKAPNWSNEDAENVVYAPHWYDPIVLIRKSYNRWINFDRELNKLVIGPGRIQRSFAEQLERQKLHAREEMNNIPVVISEIGIAMDLDHKRAYQDGNFGAQIKAYDRTIRALEKNLHHYILWNYTADNDNCRGDQWNDEDLSIFSRDQQEDPANINSGGRALEAILRPYPVAISGIPLTIKYNYLDKLFEFRFQGDSSIKAATVLFVPNFQYLDGYDVDLSSGTYQQFPYEQLLYYYPDKHEQVHFIRLRAS